MIVVAGYPGGSPDIPQSMELLGKHIGPLREMGIQIVDSIEELLDKVDVVLVVSIDGRVHLHCPRGRHLSERLPRVVAHDNEHLAVVGFVDFVDGGNVGVFHS